MDQFVEGSIHMTRLLEKANLSSDDEQKLISALDRRFKIISNMTSMQINLFKGRSIHFVYDGEKPTEDLLRYLMDVKWALLYSFPHKLLHYDMKRNEYKTLHGVRVPRDEVLRQFRIKNAAACPQFVIM